MRPSPTLLGQKILVVEDEWMIAQHLSLLLEDMDFEVVGPAGSVSEAIAKIDDDDIDCVLLDANLKGTSSAPIADALVTKNVPFIMVTGYGNLELPTDAMNAAPRLTKPFADYELENALRALFPGHASAA